MAEYIEREAVRRAVFDAAWLNSQDEDVAYDVLESVPAAEFVPVVHGRWNEETFPFCNYCPNCYAVVERGCVRWGTGGLNYCPNCGAKMDLGE